MNTAIIIGAGVTGLSTAYHLARRGYGRVTVLDKGPVGDGSSRRAAGIITALLWSETGVRARLKSLELYRDLSRDLDGYQFQAVGCLNLFDPPSWPEREKLLPLYDRLGVPYDILDAAAMRRRWPDLHPHAEWIGLLDPQGGYSEPDEYLPALAARVRALGVHIREGERVDGVLRDGGRVLGVRTAQGDLYADAVVSTVYAWTVRLLEPLGIPMPVKAFVHQRYVTRPLPTPPHFPAVNANPLGGYIRPASGDRLLVGVETPDRLEHKVASPDFHLSSLAAPDGLAEQAWAGFVDYAPALASTGWEDERVGLITFSMDGEPILGPVAGYPGLFVGTAFHSGGFAYNPVVGLLLAEYVADGHTSLDVSAFSPNRFDPDAARDYLASTVPQSQSFKRRH